MLFDMGLIHKKLSHLSKTAVEKIMFSPKTWRTEKQTFDGHTDILIYRVVWLL